MNDKWIDCKEEIKKACEHHNNGENEIALEKFLKIKSLTCISGDGLVCQEVNEAHIRNTNALEKIIGHLSRTRSTHDADLQQAKKILLEI